MHAPSIATLFEPFILLGLALAAPISPVSLKERLQCDGLEFGPGIKHAVEQGWLQPAPMCGCCLRNRAALASVKQQHRHPGCKRRAQTNTEIRQ